MMRTLPQRGLTILFAPCLFAACRTGRHEYTLKPTSVRPEERAAIVAALPPCAPIAPAPASWPTVQLTTARGTIQLPPRLATAVGEAPSSDWEAWDDSTTGQLLLQRDPSAASSSGFMLMPDSKPGMTFVHEGDCAQSFDGRLSRLRRTLWVDSTHAIDTIFIATTDVPLGGDVQLGAGVIGSSRAGRESLLSALASLRLQVP